MNSWERRFSRAEYPLVFDGVAVTVDMCPEVAAIMGESDYSLPGRDSPGSCCGNCSRLRWTSPSQPTTRTMTSTPEHRRRTRTSPQPGMIPANKYC